MTRVVFCVLFLLLYESHALVWYKFSETKEEQYLLGVEKVIRVKTLAYFGVQLPKVQTLKFNINIGRNDGQHPLGFFSILPFFKQTLIGETETALPRIWYKMNGNCEYVLF